jgi:hypothetical protein
MQIPENPCSSVKPQYTSQLLLYWNTLSLERFALH